MSEKPAQSRKRQASASLRAVASELHITGMRRSYDMSKADFSSLLKDVLAQSSTPDQRRRAEEAKAAYFETAGVSLPAIPAFPAAVTDGNGPSASSQPPGFLAAEPPERTTGQKEFRLRGTSCLFTYNSPTFSRSEAAAVWDQFLRFLASLTFVARWTATLEESLRSADNGRVHLHAFLEFVKEVDWTSLALVTFQGVRPNAKATVARGQNQR